MENACRILVRETEGKRLLQTSGHLWEDNIKMDLKEVGSTNATWIKVTEQCVQ
jgi:hypothetical protein